MKKSKFAESQVVQALEEYEEAKNVDDICRQLGIIRNKLHNWKREYSEKESELRYKN